MAKESKKKNIPAPKREKPLAINGSFTDVFKAIKQQRDSKIEKPKR